MYSTSVEDCRIRLSAFIPPVLRCTLLATGKDVGRAGSYSTSVEDGRIRLSAFIPQVLRYTLLAAGKDVGRAGIPPVLRVAE
jgi:hypothetical protein